MTDRDEHRQGISRNGDGFQQSTSQNKIPEAISELQTDLYKKGYSIAVSSGRFSANSQEEDQLKEYAHALVSQAAKRESYDPTNNHSDKLREEEFDRDRCCREQLEGVVHVASTEVVKSENGLADIQPCKQPGEIANGIVIPVVAVIAITVIPTLHDYIFVMETQGDIFSWILSGASGVVLGLLLTRFMLFGISEKTDQRNAVNMVGLISGILVFLCLGFLRISQAEGFGDYVFAASITGIEAAIILALEYVAMKSRKAWQIYYEHQSKRDIATAKLEVARVNLSRSQQELKERNDKINRHIKNVEDVSILASKASEIEAAAINAIIAGYRQGISDNKGLSVLGPTKEGYYARE